jgi:hypothetical protein
MLSAPARRVVPFVLFLIFSLLIPIVGYQMDHQSSIEIHVLSWIVKAIFPLQIFPIVFFLLKLFEIEGFWTSYALYAIIVGLIVFKAMRQEMRFFSKRNFIIFLGLSTTLYIANEAIFYYQVSNILHALPPQPVVP